MLPLPLLLPLALLLIALTVSMYSGKLRLFRAAVAPSPTPQLELQLISAKDGGSNASVSSHPAGWSDPCPGGKCRIDFSSLCWFYGRNLYETLEPKRPIGLLASYQVMTNMMMLLVLLLVLLLALACAAAARAAARADTRWPLSPGRHGRRAVVVARGAGGQGRRAGGG